jgi:hypothetical protein
MPSATTSALSAASGDLGFGSTLSQQVDDESEEEKRRKRLGLSTMQSPAAQMLLGGNGYGMAGVGKV